ncbi:MAG: hypothetical protein UT05_C0014G0019 [Parcubacteria group bacterium GW2011_GWF2_38_76]|nr:MAG: hypothetical protein UT05_C0014G0019 [Parcubacteria group bacterium GW2011_GWF2_38_76]
MNDIKSLCEASNIDNKEIAKEQSIDIKQFWNKFFKRFQIMKAEGGVKKFFD